MRNFIDIVESRTITESTVQSLYHCTPRQNLESILRDGIKPKSYWAIDEVSDYYAEDITDNGDEVVTFLLPISRLLSPVPDMPGIEEPVVYQSLGKREEQVHSEWFESDKSWQASLEIIGSIACEGLIRVTEDDIVNRDEDY